MEPPELGRLGPALFAAAILIASSASGAENLLEPAVEKVLDTSEDSSSNRDEPRNFVVVPIPLSNPTLGSGLVLGGAYFYRQTPEQRSVQPPSVTGIAGMYTDNESSAFGLGHQQYWGGDRWRFTGILGRIDLSLDLLDPDPAGPGVDVDWMVEGDYVEAKLMRQLAGDWYLGVRGRYFESRQTFAAAINIADFDTGIDLKASGLGLTVEYDTRDLPANAYAGMRFELGALFNEDSLGGSNNYDGYGGNFRSYHEVAEEWVVAWAVQGCHRSGRVPLWDACRVDLRGFPATEYLARTTATAQVEGRWRPFKRFGFVAFVGGGLSERSHAVGRDDSLIPSYGVGARWMVMTAQRINVRLDYARSEDRDAWYLAVSEVF